MTKKEAVEYLKRVLVSWEVFFDVHSNLFKAIKVLLEEEEKIIRSEKNEIDTE